MDGPGAGDGTGSADGDERPSNKVARLVDRHDMDGVAAELERGWTATGETHRSLRELADVFNRRLLERRLAAADQQALDDEVETLYALLTDDDVGEGDRVSVRRRLEGAGVDVDRLLDEFVSYQTVRRYLQDHRGASYERAETNRVETVDRQLQQLRGRVDAVTRSKLERLRGTDDLSLGEFRTTVDVRVYCEDCGAQYRTGELLDRGGCDCE